MRILTILLFTINFSFGQTAEVSHKDFETDEIKGEYSIVWSVDKSSIIGENLRLKKHKKFEHQVFSGTTNNGWTEAKIILTFGKYEIKNDTLKLNTKNKANKSKGEIFSFKEKYIVKKFDLRTESDEKSKTYIFVCLVPVDKLDIFVTETDNLVKTLCDIAMSKFDDYDYWQFIGLGREVERIFWNNRIFLKKG